MLPSNPIAFKEWAAVCAALEDGRQTIIVRKGGIHEGRDGFRVAHGEFWLFPTYFHETGGELVDEAGILLERAERERPAEGTLRIGQYAVVSDVIEVRDERLLTNLAGLHLWSPQTLSERFRYRQPGVFVLVARIYQCDSPFVIPDSPHFAGCRSWVELQTPLPTDGLKSVLTGGEFAAVRQQVRDALSPTTIV